VHGQPGDDTAVGTAAEPGLSCVAGITAANYRVSCTWRTSTRPESWRAARSRELRKQNHYCGHSAGQRERSFDHESTHGPHLIEDLIKFAIGSPIIPSNQPVVLGAGGGLLLLVIAHSQAGPCGECDQASLAR
jgi:hypothetical protein